MSNPTDSKGLKLLFIINPGSGNNNSMDYAAAIKDYFKNTSHQVELYELPPECSPEHIKAIIKESQSDRVVAVGGDGTVKLAAQGLLGTTIPLCILPAGSANGMAQELGIDKDPAKALAIIEKGRVKKISLIRINDQLCIHLSDIGFNAYAVKKFESGKKRGMWAYIKAAWKVLWSHSRMEVNITTDQEEIRRSAAMVVIANATKYGTGVLINPKGNLSDDLFEVIIVKKISLMEIFKMRFTHSPYNPSKTELFQTRSLTIKSRHRVHFQVDGEYMGKINTITADILPEALQVVVPPD